MSEWTSLRPKSPEPKPETEKSTPIIVTPLSISEKYGYTEDSPMLWILYLQLNPEMPETEKKFIHHHITKLRTIKRAEEDRLILEFNKRRDEFIEEGGNPAVYYKR